MSADAHRHLEDVGPLSRRAERRGGPVVQTHALGHLAVADKDVGVERPV